MDKEQIKYCPLFTIAHAVYAPHDPSIINTAYAPHGRGMPAKLGPERLCYMDRCMLYNSSQGICTLSGQSPLRDGQEQ